MDLLLGKPEIARFLGIGESTVEKLGRSGELPLFKLGARWAARPDALRRCFAEREAAASRPPITAEGA